MTLGLKGKLGLGFGLLIVMICGLGGYSLLQMDGIDRRSQEIALNWLPSVGAAHELDTAAADLRATAIARGQTSTVEDLVNVLLAVVDTA